MNLISGFQPKSLLAFLVAFGVILIALGIALGNSKLESFGWLLFVVFGFFFILFLLLTIIRNIKSI